MSTFSQDPGGWRWATPAQFTCQQSPKNTDHFAANGNAVCLLKRAKEQKQSSLDSRPITGNRSSGGRGVNVRSHRVAQTQTQQSYDRVYFHPPA